MKRIAVAGFQHETNTFAIRKADFKAFQMAKDWPGLCQGEDVIHKTNGFNLPITGAIESLTKQGLEIIPLSWAFAVPSGLVTRDAYETLASLILDALTVCGPVDGLYLDLHGAMVTEHFEDAEGELLRRIKMQIGTDIPVAASLDYHANITEQMVEFSDYLDVFRHYPHTDMAETGARVAQVLGKMVREDRRFLKQFCKSEYLIPLFQGCTTEEPCKRLTQGDLQGIRERLPDFHHISFAAGFALADIEEAGPAIVAYGSDGNKIRWAIEEFKHKLDLTEGLFNQPGLPVLEAVETAVRIGDTASKPVILADAQDNPGAGGTADTMGLLKTLIRLQASNTVCGFIADPLAAEAAWNAGVGSVITVNLGGRGFEGDSPLTGDFKVIALGSGNVVGTGPMWQGARMQLGPCALLEYQKVRIAVSTKIVQTGDTALFRHLGVEPEQYSIVAIKSSVHFRAAFEPLAEQVILVLSPGPVIGDPTELDYSKLRKDVRIGPNLDKIKAVV